MDNGIWKIATAKLCGQCIRDMEDEYIFSPRWRRTLGGTCERCGENRIVREVQYTMNKRGLEKSGKLTFDSKKEAERYDALMLLQKAGEIRVLKLQVRYCLQEAYTTFEGERVKSIDYIADFVYERRTAPDSYGQRYWLPVVEDVKGMRTREYAMKAKLFCSRYGFAIREV